jgi:hypothetical protein
MRFFVFGLYPWSTFFGFENKPRSVNRTENEGHKKKRAPLGIFDFFVRGKRNFE